MWNHFKTYSPSSNLKSAAVAKKTHRQLRDNRMTQAGARSPSKSQKPSTQSCNQIVSLWLQAFGSFLPLGSEGYKVSAGLNTIYKSNYYPAELQLVIMKKVQRLQR